MVPTSTGSMTCTHPPLSEVEAQLQGKQECCIVLFAGNFCIILYSVWKCIHALAAVAVYLCER